MSDGLIFYTNPMSRGRIVRWMLEEIGRPYHTEVFGYGAPMKGDYRRINPMGKVPAIQHRGVVVTEVAAICLYLADAFPEVDLAPPTASPERGAYYRWMLFGAGPMEAAIVNKTLGVQPSEEQKRFVGYGDYETVLATLDAHFSGSDYAAGSRFTAADVSLGSQIVWGLQFGTLEARLSFLAYRERLQQRPAFSRARDIDDELLKSQSPA